MSLKFALGTPAYCREILAWLEQEHAESGGGFFCKASTISEYFQEQNALCALIDDRVVAFAVFYVAPPASGISVIEVHPAFRGRCFGRQLLQETLSHLRQKGAQYASADCTSQEGLFLFMGSGFIPRKPRPGAARTHILAELRFEFT